MADGLFFPGIHANKLKVEHILKRISCMRGKEVFFQIMNRHHAELAFNQLKQQDEGADSWVNGKLGTWRIQDERKRDIFIYFAALAVKGFELLIQYNEEVLKFTVMILVEHYAFLALDMFIWAFNKL